MPDLLLELLSEEMPARILQKAAGNLRKLVTDELINSGLVYEGAKEYWTPRRLTIDIRGVGIRSTSMRKARRGPRIDAPSKAIEGFIRSAGLNSIEEAEIHHDPEKGDFYVAVIEKQGREAIDIISDIMPGIIRNFPWPRSMRWGEASSQPGSLAWIRPLRSILCVFGPETEEPETVEFEVGGIRSSNMTYGRALTGFPNAPAIRVRRFEDYRSCLYDSRIIIDSNRRKEMILADAGNLAFAQGLELVEDERLLEETSDLVEWPTVLMGEFGKEFLNLPPEVIQLTIRENQKCFVLKSCASGKLVNHFLLVSNIAPHDGGKKVIRGNNKVVNARLSDAEFFWQGDLAQVTSEEGFQPWIEKLDTVTFHAGLGTQGDRTRNIMALSEKLAAPVAKSMETALTGSGNESGEATMILQQIRDRQQMKIRAERAAELCKADLNSAMVYEFPELQGVMGKAYALRAGEDGAVAAVIEEHYKPLGRNDRVPYAPISIVVALADKVNTLVGFWIIKEKPTGNKDPFALRRAALGIIRIILENNLRLNLSGQFRDAGEIYLQKNRDLSISKKVDMESVSASLLSFFHERLKNHLRNEGMRHDLIEAVTGVESDDLFAIVQHAEKLQTFINTREGEYLLAGYKRVANILAVEEKKTGDAATRVKTELLRIEAEIKLNEKLNLVESLVREAVEKEDYPAAMSAMVTVCSSLDSFFENVMVNDREATVRANRLALLSRVRSITMQVTDFSKIGG